MNDERLDKLESDMMDLHADVKANTALTLDVKNSVVEILDTFNSLKGFWKVLEFVGKAAKPILWIGGTSTIVVLWWRDFLEAIKRLMGH